jgi:hypothetical protein
MQAQTKEAFLEFEGVSLAFDVVENETLTHTATATDHPVEQGSDVSDNIRSENSRIALKVYVSNTPVRDVNGLWGGGQVAGIELKVPTKQKPVAPTPGAAMVAGINALANAIAGAQPWVAMVRQFEDRQDAVAFVLGQLIDWQERGVIGKCITPHRTYESVVLTSVEMGRDGQTGTGAGIDIELRTIRVVEAALITAPVPTEDRGKTKQKKGRQPTSFVRDPDTKKQKSGFKALKDRAAAREPTSFTRG